MADRPPSGRELHNARNVAMLDTFFTNVRQAWDAIPGLTARLERGLMKLMEKPEAYRCVGRRAVLVGR